MHTYYKQFIDTEHYLLQKEIAAISGFVSTGNNPHTQLIGAALKEYVTKHNVEPIYYYSTLYKTMLSVFPQKVYRPMLEELYSRTSENTRGNIQIGGKTYAYILTKKLAFGGAA